MRPTHFVSEEEFARIQARVRGGVDRTRAVVGVQVSEKPGAAPDSPPSRVWVKSVSNPAPSPYKSKWEAAYAAKLELEKQAGVIKQWWYEPFSLWLPGKVRYKPDFMVERENYAGIPPGETTFTELEIIEVKGWSKNLRDGKTRLKIAAALFPCFVWRLVYRTKGGGWDGEYL